MTNEVNDRTAESVDVVVVGAGFAGLYAVHRLHQRGFTLRAFEASPSVGGVWYWNRYPGCRCDLESIYYSYSFSPELDQEWHWTERYASRSEVLSYLDHVADRFDLRRHISFETLVTEAFYDENLQRWKITTDKGDHVVAKYLVTAVGCLSVPKRPDFAGLEDFEGEWYHTGDWPNEGVDFTGKRVAVIGTGSSGIQSIPLIAEQAAQLTVFQRTPTFAMPARNAPMDPSFEKEIKEKYPEMRAAARTSGFGIAVEIPKYGALEVSEEERRARYEAGWKEGGLFSVLGRFKDLMMDQAANDTATDFIRSKIREVVRDPARAEILSPTTYPVGAKRPCLDTNYFQTFNRDNVDLVDVRTNPIVSITPTGIQTTERSYELDAIVFAIGFDAMTGALLRMDIRGRGGLSLRDKWKYGPVSYLGLAVAGFPNLFMITGPGSPSVRSNVPVSIEQHVEWIVDCLDDLRRRDVGAIEATEDAQLAWVDHVREAAENGLWSKADSWYIGANVPGKPRVYMPYVGGVGNYRAKCEAVAANGYEGFTLESLSDESSRSQGQVLTG